MANYTRGEKVAIESAYSALAYLAEIHSSNYDLKDALKYERKQRRDILTAKSLLVSSASEPTKNAADIFHYSKGCQFAHLFGAHLREIQANAYAWQSSWYNKFIELAEKAEICKKAESERRWNSLKSELVVKYRENETGLEFSVVALGSETVELKGIDGLSFVIERAAFDCRYTKSK